MTERYDERAATHYAAYRPPLHEIILGRVLSRGGRSRVGADVGCGTGCSALALANHCERVYGVDPSLSMLSRATPHPAVRYLCGAGERIPIATGSIDVVTFAGSLFYADSDDTRAEVRRICPAGTVVVYDFEVLLGTLLQRFGLASQALHSDYDHRASFWGAPGFRELTVGSERVRLEVTAAELAHVLLSDSNRFDQFARRYNTVNSFPALLDDLRPGPDRHTVEADIYYSTYKISASRVE